MFECTYLNSLFVGFLCLLQNPLCCLSEEKQQQKNKSVNFEIILTCENNKKQIKFETITDN